MSELRQRALDLLKGSDDLNHTIDSDDLPELLQELRIAHIELELQNEELRDTQVKLELAHRKYFDYYELAPVGYLTLDTQGVIIEANLTAHTMLNDVGRRLFGKTLWRYIHPDDRQAFHDHLQQALTGEQATLIAVRLIGHDDESQDSALYVQLDSQPHPLLSGDIGALVTMTDITDRHQLERELQHQKNRLQDAQRQAKLGYWRRNFETGAGEWSEQTYRLLGYEPYSVPVIHENFIKRVHPDDVESIRQAIRATLEAQIPINREIRLVLPYDTVRIVHIRSFNHEDENPASQEIFGIIQDITELRQAQDEAIKAELDRARMMVLTDFIRDSSHEFRTPLTILQSSIELVKRKDDIGFFHQRYPRIVSQIQRIERILDTMLLSSKLSMTDAIELEEINLKSMFDNLHYSLRDKLASFNKELHFHLPDEDIIIKGSAHLLIDALYEVLYNAVRHSGDGDHVRVDVTIQEHQIVLAVRDYGEGIAPEIRERVFEAFYRQDEAHTSSGTGLGLTITKQIIDLHEGRIWLENSEPRGTTVYIALPTG